MCGVLIIARAFVPCAAHEVDVSSVLVVMTIDAKQLPVTAVLGVVVMVVIAMVHRELA